MFITDVVNFINKFFGFYKVENDEMHEYNDNLGYGTFQDGRHIFWIATIIIIAIILYQFCKKDKVKGKKLVKAIVTVVLTIRIVLQIIKTIVGNSLPHGRDLIPGQMCTILIYLLPLTILCNWKKIRTPVCVLSMMGGIMTFLINDYFDSRFISFYALEGIWAHTMLFVIPIALMGLGEFKLEAKNIWQVIVTMLIMLCWATFLNKVVFVKYKANYFYLENNMLPGNLGGKYFFFIYIIIFFVLLFLIFMIPVLYKNIAKVLIKENKNLKKKLMIITIINILIISLLVTICAISRRKPKISEEEEKVNLAVLLSSIENKSTEFAQEQIQRRLDSIVGEDKVEVSKGLIELKVKFKKTGNVYRTVNSQANIKMVVIKQKVNKILKYVLGVILIINLIIMVILIFLNLKKR